MSQALRKMGKAHLSVTVDARRTWSLTLAERRVDMASVLDAIPPDQHLLQMVKGWLGRETKLQDVRDFCRYRTIIFVCLHAKPAQSSITGVRS